MSHFCCPGHHRSDTEKRESRNSFQTDLGRSRGRASCVKHHLCSLSGSRDRPHICDNHQWAACCQQHSCINCCTSSIMSVNHVTESNHFVDHILRNFPRSATINSQTLSMNGQISVFTQNVTMETLPTVPQHPPGHLPSQPEPWRQAASILGRKTWALPP